MTFISYAQNFEDVILWRAFGHVERGNYVDIGAQDPELDSISLAFYRAGWRGTHVEATPFYARRLREARPDETVIEAAVTDAIGPIEFYEIPDTGLSTGKPEIAARHAATGYKERKILVPCIRLDQLLETAGPDIHWMKIDVEGMEADVLRSWGDSRRRPWVVLVESNFPGTQAPSEQLWIDEVLGRGYREIQFDGLNRYFVHKDHQELGSAFVSPPNVFDQFQVTSAHFTASLLVQESTEETERLRTQAGEREAQFNHEMGSLRGQLEQAQVEAAEREAQLGRELAEARTAQQIASAAAQEARTARTEAIAQLATSEREYRAALGRLSRERLEAEAALRAHWDDLERRLRDTLSSLEARLRRSETQLAAFRERSAHQQKRTRSLERELESARSARIAALDAIAAAEREHRDALKQFEQERRELERIRDEKIEALTRETQAVGEEVALLRDRNAALSAEAARLTQALHRAEHLVTEERKDAEQRATELVQQSELRRQEETSALHRQLEERDQQIQHVSARASAHEAWIAQANALVQQALAEPAGLWHRLGRTLGLSGEDGARRVLQSWSALDPQSAVESTEYAMHVAPPRQAKNPYLRANSLAELLSWHDVEFVRCAYVTILGRQPDPEGEAHYTERVRQGHSKMDVLWQLRRSDEAWSHDPGIAGLDRALRTAARMKTPVLGRIVRLFSKAPYRELADNPERAVANALEVMLQWHAQTLNEMRDLTATLQQSRDELAAQVREEFSAQRELIDAAVDAVRQPLPAASEQIAQSIEGRGQTSQLAVASPADEAIASIPLPVGPVADRLLLRIRSIAQIGA
ncbi:MAG TPA: FkbM family methyltransferase [Sphingomicrobium sp.]|nr:FkbM family methyltransferase [Sphingomicrobium sp.]